MKILMIFVTKTVMRVMNKSVTSFVQQFARVPADCRGLIRIQSLTPVDKEEGRLSGSWKLTFVTILNLAKLVTIETCQTLIVNDANRPFWSTSSAIS